ncbi:MAG: (2Fe-2S)-binding protein [Candidatus Izemoplasma sp.]
MAKITFKLNNKEVVIEESPTARLLDVLREKYDFVGVKEGCGEGECGACAVLIDDKVVNSCLVPLGTVEGKNIVTIEGYAETKKYDVLKTAFEDEGAVQCGFCTPGMLIASESLLNKNPHPTDEEIKIGLSGNLCRCTGYNMIVKAVKTASKKGDGLW